MNGSPAPGEPAAWRFMLPFTLLSLTMGVGVGVAKIVMSLHALHLGAGPAMVGLIAAAGMVGMLLISVPVGFMVDHWGPMRLFAIGSVLGGGTYALLPQVSSTGLLLAAATAIGFFMPLRFVSLNTVFFSQIRLLGGGRAGWSRATHMSGMFLIGPGVGALLAGRLGYAATWSLVAASFALTLAASPLVLRHTPRGSRAAGEGIAGASGMQGADSADSAEGTPGAPGTGTGWRADLATLLHDAELREVNTIDFVGQAATQYTTTFVIVVALQRFQLDAAHASGLVTAWGGSFIASLLVGGRLAGALGPLYSRLLGFAVVVASLLLLGGSSVVAGLWAGAVLQGLGAGLVQVVNLERIAQAGSRHGQGRVSGLTLVVGPLGGLLGSMLGGLLAQWSGPQAVFVAFVPAYAALAWWQRRRHGPAASHAAA